MGEAAGRWLTYSDAAEALGLASESVRQRARRENWAKRLNNAGRATVLVPLDVAEAAGVTGGEPPGDAVGAEVVTRLVDRSALRAVRRAERLAGAEANATVQQLQSRVAELAAELARERAERERERENLTAEAGRERAERHAERDRADKLAGEIAALAGRALALAETARQTGSEPWWRRMLALAGEVGNIRAKTI